MKALALISNSWRVQKCFVYFLAQYGDLIGAAGDKNALALRRAHVCVVIGTVVTKRLVFRALWNELTTNIITL